MNLIETLKVSIIALAIFTILLGVLYYVNVTNRFLFNMQIDGKVVRCNEISALGQSGQSGKSRPIYVFYHICTAGDKWKEIVDGQLKQMVESGLYELVDTIFYGCTCVDCANQLGKAFAGHDKIKPLPGGIRDNENTWENVTLNQMIKYGQTLADRGVDADFLYLHTKGSSGKSSHQDSWREYMMFYMVKHFQYCRKFLASGYNTVGCLYSTNPRHYSGNFFWASSKYMSTIPPIRFLSIRYSAEHVLFRNYQRGKHINIGTFGEISLHIPTPIYTYATGSYKNHLVVPSDNMDITRLECRVI